MLVCTIFAFFVQTYAVRRMSPSRVGLLMRTEPVFGALFAMAWLGESLSPSAWVGGALIVAASLWGASTPAEARTGEETREREAT
ncbi:EamA family transporter [Microvirga pudoricolor]|uniref:EamA family transporter n=1 Tax=Microvirga pudoricolor TaxID=2778729 RepID=UPI00194DD2D5|nr:DMT family transporter [Microvirga pudoricolor]MBM6595620.1 DMT family transporter [Microvirga pudoricolor]